MKFFQKISSYISVREKINKLIKILPLIALGFFPSLSFAANLFEPTAGDISVKVLGTIFGGLLEGGGNDPMLNAIKMFNGGVLIVGGILAAYTILAGTLGTAHDGEMLGKKFSSVWIPIRYSVGTALVLPVVGGGYCVMQAIVIWLVVQGIGLADQVWITFMSNPGSTANTVTENTSKQKITDVAESAFRSAVCYRSYDKAIQESVQGSGVGATLARALEWNKLYKYSRRESPNGYVFGDEKSLVRSAGCGVVNYPKFDSATTNDAAGTDIKGNAGTYQGRLGTFDNIFQPVNISSVLAAHKKETDTLVKSMDALAARVVDKAQTLTRDEALAFYKEMQTATDVYLQNMRTAATTASSSEDGFKRIQEASKVQGWMLAGAWFTRIVQMNESIHSALNSTPTASTSRPAVDSALYADAAKFLESTDIIFDRVGNLRVMPTPSEVSNDPQGNPNKKGEKVDTKSAFAWIENVFTDTLTTGVDLYELKNDSRHPLIIAAAIGNRLENVAFILMGVMTGGAIALSVAAMGGLSAGIIGNALTVMGWFTMIPINVLIASSLMLKYFIPNLPFLIWIGCIIGWTLLVIEAVIAAPLWAIMHLHPNGDDLTGRGGNGYMLVLSLLLRPVLMIFGLIASIVISSVIGEFINKTFFEVFSNNIRLSGTAAFFSLVAGSILYLVIMTTFIRKTFGIMHQLPDQLLKWIGGGDQALGQFAGEFNAAGEKAQAVGSMIGGHIGDTMNKLAMGAARGIAKRGNELNQKANSEEGVTEGQAKLMNFFGNNVQPTAGDSKGKFRTQKGEDAYSAAMEKERSAAIDAEVGAGTSQARDELTNSSFQDRSVINESNSPSLFKNSFNEGVRQSNLIGGPEARDDYITRMRESQEGGYANYGGNATLAAQSIGQDVIKDQISMRSYGITGNQNNSGIQSFAKVMGDRGGSLNGRNAGAALNLANRMSKTVGPSAVNDIMQRAVDIGGGDKEAIKSYVNQEYESLKAQKSPNTTNVGSNQK